MRNIVRDIENNRLLISDDVQEKGFSVKPDFREKMLVNNHIEGLLELKVYTTNNYKTYEYDTSGLSTLESACGRRQMNCDRVRRFLKGITDIIANGGKYLLEERDFVLSPEYIFLDRDFNPYVAYCPLYSQNISEQLGGLAEYLMNRIDYHDKDAVLLTYTVYMKSREEGFSVEEVGRYLDEAGRETSGRTHDNDFELKELTSEVNKANNTPAFALEERLFSYSDLGGEVEKGEKSSIFHPGDLHCRSTNLGSARLRHATNYDEGALSRSSGDNEVQSEKMPGHGRPLVIVLILICPFLVIIASYKAGLIFDKTGKVDMVKLAAVSVLCIGIAVYFIKKQKGWKSRKTQNETAKPQNKEDCTELLSLKGRNEDDETELLFDRGFEGGDSEIYSLESEELGRIMITHFPFFIGKDERRVDYALVKSGVSRKHIVIDKMESGIGVQDLDSTNGTYINGQRIMPESLVKIKHGDELRIGVCTYILSSSVSSMTKK